MCETVQKFVLYCITCQRGDDLQRAKMAFKNHTPEQMNEQYGQSGKTCQQILDGYIAHEQKCDAAAEAVRRLL